MENRDYNVVGDAALVTPNDLIKRPVLEGALSRGRESTSMISASWSVILLRSDLGCCTAVSASIPDAGVSVGSGAPTCTRRRARQRLRIRPPGTCPPDPDDAGFDDRIMTVAGHLSPSHRTTADRQSRILGLTRSRFH